MFQIYCRAEEGLRDRRATRGGPVVSSAVWGSVSAIPSALGWALNAALTPCWRRGHAASHLEPITPEGLWQSPAPSAPCSAVQRRSDHSYIHIPPLSTTRLFIFVPISSSFLFCFCKMHTFFIESAVRIKAWWFKHWPCIHNVPLMSKKAKNDQTVLFFKKGIRWT